MEPYSAAVLAALEVIRCDREKQKRLIQGLVARDLCDKEDAAAYEGLPLSHRQDACKG